ncbi:MAG: SpoIIE family protein phosphatase [Planctomycetes bacterium]|nr:SpoIIE family protein phosphatase [Planctomycetota bacterium]
MAAKTTRRTTQVKKRSTTKVAKRSSSRITKEQGSEEAREKINRLLEISDPDISDKKVINGEVLARVSAVLALGEPLGQTLTSCLALIASEISADTIAIFMLENTYSQLVPLAVYGLSRESITPYALPHDNGIEALNRSGGYELFQHEPALICRNNFDETAFTQAIYTPIFYRDICVGVITASSKKKTHKFSHAHRALMEAISAQVALASHPSMPREDIMARERMERALQFAHTIQQHFTPHRLPEFEGYRVAAHRNTSLDMGGDFYDIIEMPEKRYAFIVGETSGHGLDTAFHMARTISEMRGILAVDSGVSQTLSRLNYLMVEEVRCGFLTNMTIAILNTTTGEVTYSGAGNAHLCMVQPQKHSVQWMEVENTTPIGVMADRWFMEEKGIIQPGGALLMHTGDLTRCLAKVGQHVEQRDFDNCILQGMLKDHPVAEHLYQCLIDHLGTHLTDDDITFLSVERLRTTS